MMKKKTIVLMVLTLAGCDKAKSDPSATTTTTTTTTAAATVTANEILTATVTATAPATTAAPSASAASGSLLPDYPGAKVTKKTADSVTLETKDAPDKVVAFYKEKLAAAGFPKPASASLVAAPKDQPTVMTAAKGSQMLQITITPIQGTTKISVSSI